MSDPETSLKVRSWYGLPGEIVIEHDFWHLVRVGSVSLPHPPLVNLFIRQGLPHSERRRLSYWHEFGHLQTLPLALLHMLWLLRPGVAPPRSWKERLARWASILLAHQALWELASEGYVVSKAGPASYRQIYRTHPNPWLRWFWVGMAGLALVGSWLARGKPTPWSKQG